ncbi:hypothetical protein, partial [Methylobacterium sp. ap11]|uniref:hypothetical protein n=1 Tax=Methylobacterium sp. ap11 TaxID=1761799 RepID=UPI001AECF2C2
DNAGAGWNVAGTGDFNGDSQSDVVLHGAGGTVAAWLMNGTNVSEVSPIGYAGENWGVVAG